MPRNEHISSLGFRLETTDDVEAVQRLLEASNLEPIHDEQSAGQWQPSHYLIACTTAGGTAACVGWARGADKLVLHSLAVAPPSRGSGIGASMLATALSQIMADDPVTEAYLTTNKARAFFADFSFESIEEEEVPEAVATHPAFEYAPADSQPMVRRYRPIKRGLDQCAFRLVHNTTEDATMPPGSVFFFRQSGSIIEANYRGTPVRRGHLIGSIQGQELRFLWHQALDSGELAEGDGRIFVDELDDGRRELREKLGHGDPGELLLREV